MSFIKLKKLIVTLSMALVLLLQSVFFVSAYEIRNAKNYTVIQLSNNNILIKGEDGSSETLNLNYLRQTKNGNIGKIYIHDNIQNNDYYFEYRNDGSVYSSKTGKIISPEINIQDRSSTSYIDKYYSYKQIYQMVGTVTTIAGFAGGIVGLAVRSGIVIAGSSIIELISNLSGIIGPIGLLSGSDKHGIAIRYKVTKYYRRRAGMRTCYRTDFTPVKAWKY